MSQNDFWKITVFPTLAEVWEGREHFSGVFQEVCKGNLSQVLCSVFFKKMIGFYLHKQTTSQAEVGTFFPAATSHTFIKAANQYLTVRFAEQ